MDNVHLLNETPEDWFRFVNSLFNFIDREMSLALSNPELYSIYPKLVIQYQFFRLIRGEAFHKQRPQGIGQYQKSIYDMEHTLLRKLNDCKRKLSTGDQRVEFYINEMKKGLDL